MPTAREALVEASDFARDVWRDCWTVMLVIVVGRTLVFLGHHVSETEWNPGFWPKIGEVLSLAYIPLFGALYRLGVGGRALNSLGWGGLQWTGVEWRLLGVWIVLGFALSICAAPLALVSFPLLYLFKHHAAVSLGPLGGWSFASILLAPFWLGFAAFVLFMWGRLGLAAATTTARERVSPFASWSLTRGMGWTIALAWVITQLPMVLGWIGLWIMGVAEAGDLSAGPTEIWPLTDAAIAGTVVAVLGAVIQVPLSVGLFSGLYRWLAADLPDVVGAVSSPSEELSSGLLEDDLAPVEEPPLPEELEGPLSVWPHTVLPRGIFRRKHDEPEATPQYEDEPPLYETEAAITPEPETEPEPLFAALSEEPTPEATLTEHAETSAHHAGPALTPEPFHEAEAPLASQPEAGQTSHTDPEPNA